MKKTNLLILGMLIIAMFTGCKKKTYHLTFRTWHNPDIEYKFTDSVFYFWEVADSNYLTKYSKEGSVRDGSVRGKTTATIGDIIKIGFTATDNVINNDNELSGGTSCESMDKDINLRVYSHMIKFLNDMDKQYENILGYKPEYEHEYFGNETRFLNINGKDTIITFKTKEMQIQ